MNRERTRRLRKEGLLYAFFMMLQSNVEKQLLSENILLELYSFTLNVCMSRCNVYCCMLLSRYYDTYLPFLLEACNDESPDVRQVCSTRKHSLFSSPDPPDLSSKLYFIFRLLYTGLVSVQSLGDQFLDLLLEVG